MSTVKFDTKVSKKGIIQIPKNIDFNEEEVEVTIVSKELKPVKTNVAHEFIENWAGFLNTEDTNRSKTDYLSKKYK